jgi:hypothetical protein
MFSCLMLIRNMLWLRELCSFMSAGGGERQDLGQPPWNCSPQPQLTIGCDSYPPREKDPPAPGLPPHLPGQQASQARRGPSSGGHSPPLLTCPQEDTKERQAALQTHKSLISPLTGDSHMTI